MSARGEGYLTVGEEQVTILFTNRALAQAEMQLGKTVLQIANDAAAGDLGITDVARLLLVGMQAARRDLKLKGTPPGIKDAFAVMDEAGFAEAARVVMETLATVLSYDPNEGEETDADPPE